MSRDQAGLLALAIVAGALWAYFNTTRQYTITEGGPDVTVTRAGTGGAPAPADDYEMF